MIGGSADQATAVVRRLLQFGGYSRRRVARASRPCVRGSAKAKN